MRFHVWRLFWPIAQALAGGVLAGPALAGGFFSPYQSGPAIGAGLAGASARNDDASFLFYNPASIAGATRAEAVLDARAYWPTVEITVDHATSPLGTDITSGGDSGPFVGPAIGPTSFFVLPLSKDLTVGASGTSHFAGLAKLDPGWAGRFQMIESEITGANVTSVLAWQVTPWLAVSAGPQLQFLKTSFNGAVMVPVPGGLVESIGFVDGRDWAWGAVAGVMLTPFDGTRVGLSYRSNMTHELEGHAGVDVPGIPRDTTKYNFYLPEVVSAGLEQRLSPELRLFAELQWVNWSRFTGFDISFGSGRPNEVAQVAWEDTWLGALGFGWRLNEGLEVTAGVSIDTAASKGASPYLVPDSRRLMVGAGLSYDIGQGNTIALHYAHVFFEDLEIDVQNSTKGTLQGTFEASIDMVGFTLHMPVGQ